MIIGDFHDERLKMAFGQLLIVLRVKVEFRFALRSTVSKIMAIKVLVVAATLDFSEHLETAKMAFGLIHISPWG